MTVTVSGIFRHPLKAIGRETLERVKVTAGMPLPHDRSYAVAHDTAKTRGRSPGWAHKMNFLRGVSGPSLMAVEAKLDEDGGRLRLTHPRREDIGVQFGNDAEEAALLSWLEPLWPPELPRPARIVHTEGVNLTDVDAPWVSILNAASHRSIAHRLGLDDLSIHRWRGNFVLDGLAPWQEFEWIGQKIQIDGVELRVEQRITRCKATMANPMTGRRDADTLGALEAGWGHTDFGVYATILTDGVVEVGNGVDVPS